MQGHDPSEPTGATNGGTGSSPPIYERQIPGWLRGSATGWTARTKTDAQARFEAILRQEADVEESLVLSGKASREDGVVRSILRSAADDFRRLMNDAELAALETMSDAEMRAMAMAIRIFAPELMPPRIRKPPERGGA